MDEVGRTRNVEDAAESISSSFDDSSKILNIRYFRFAVKDDAWPAAGSGMASPTPLRAAYVLHGKLGAIDRNTGAPTSAVDGAEPGLDLLVMCYAALWRHVIERNRKRYQVDLIGHSWNPSIGAALDALYRPLASVHEPEQIQRNTLLCRSLMPPLRNLATSLNRTFGRFGPVGRGTSSCDRTASHLLGMQRAIQLKAATERRFGFTYDLVIVARWDVMWNRPVALHAIDVQRGAF